MKYLQEIINQLFNVDDNTSATLLITLLVFTLGYLFAGVFNLFKGIKKRIINKRLMALLIKSAIESSHKQSIQFQNSSNSISIQYITGVPMKRVSFYQLTLLNSLGYKDAFEAHFLGIENLNNRFISNTIKLKSFIKIFDIITGAEFWIEKAFQNADELIILVNEYGKKRNDALELFRTYCDEIMQFILNDGVESKYVSYFNELDDILVDWQSTPNATLPYIAHTKLVVPLLKLNRKNRNVPYILKMNDYLLQADFSYKQMCNIIETYKIQFAIYAANFRRNYRLLKVAAKILQIKLR